MIEILIVKNERVTVTPQALLISSFKSIWEKHPKDEALIRLGYIEFMVSHKKSNTFIGYPLEERPVKILESLMVNPTEEQMKEIINDGDVVTAMEWYSQTMREASPSIRFYEASVDAAQGMIDFFTTLNRHKP